MMRGNKSDGERTITISHSHRRRKSVSVGSTKCLRLGFPSSGLLCLLCFLFLMIRLDYTVAEAAPETAANANSEVDPDDFGTAFMASFLMIVVSEIGDKTFFIAAVMAMRNARLTVFLGAISALALMTVLSTALGYAVPNLISRSYTRILAILLFGFFGFKMLWDAYKMDADESELEEVSNELESKERERQDDAMERGGSSPADRKKSWKHYATYFFSPIMIECMTLTFLAEWGDRSQIATIALAAAQNPYGVTIGAIIGHSICTGLAVIGGRMLATRISVRSVTIIGGVLFLLFALFDAVQG